MAGTCINIKPICCCAQVLPGNKVHHKSKQFCMILSWARLSETETNSKIEDALVDQIP